MGLDSQAVGNFGAPHRLTHDGQIYEFRLIDQSVKARWEKLLYERAVSALAILAQLKPKGWKESKLVEIDDDFLMGGFSFMSERSAKAIRTADGMAALLSLLADRPAGDLTPLILNKTKELKALMHLILRESFPGANSTDDSKEDEDGEGIAVPK